MMQEIQKSSHLHEFVAYYRELRPEKFSDSKIEYEIPLTKELFEKQLKILSTKKMQSNFENFIVRCAERLITPNIKPQTGPDGGGDGKVDAETYEVTTDISDNGMSLMVVHQKKRNGLLPLAVRNNRNQRLQQI